MGRQERRSSHRSFLLSQDQHPLDTRGRTYEHGLFLTARKTFLHTQHYIVILVFLACDARCWIMLTEQESFITITTSLSNYRPSNINSIMEGTLTQKERLAFYKQKVEQQPTACTISSETRTPSGTTRRETFTPSLAINATRTRAR